jgi:hypothetical protein
MIRPACIALVFAAWASARRRLSGVLASLLVVAGLSAPACVAQDTRTTSVVPRVGDPLQKAISDLANNHLRWHASICGRRTSSPNIGTTSGPDVSRPVAGSELTGT